MTETFDWRREAPWLLLAILIAATVRLIALPHQLSYWHSDSAIGSLMAKHIWTGERFPAYYYGQDYIGSLDPALAAPCYPLFADDPRGVGVAMMLCFLVALVPLHRFLHGIGGAVGARAATLVVALGSPWVVMLSTGRQYSYLSTLWLGVLMYLVGMRLVRRTTTTGVAALGLLAGIAWWNNPQVAHYLAPVLVVWWAAQGHLCSGDRLRKHALVGGAVLVAAILACAAISFVPPEARPKLGWISLQKPGRYLPRLGAMLGLLFVGLELALAPERRRWLGRLAVFGGAFAVGHAPALAVKVLGIRQGVKAPVEIDPSQILGSLPTLRHEATSVLLGAPVHLEPLPAGLRSAFDLVGLALVAVLAGLLLVQLWSTRADLGRLARGRQVALPLALWTVLQTALLVALYLCRETHAIRYLLHLWVPLAALIAWSVGRWWASRRGLVLTLLAIGLAYQAIGMASWYAWLPQGHPAYLKPLIADLEAREAVRGRASYFIAYRVTYLSGERVRIACWRPIVDRTPWDRAAVEAAPRPFALFADYPDGSRFEHINHDDAPHLRAHLEDGRPRHRWRVGPYVLFR